MSNQPVGHAGAEDVVPEVKLAQVGISERRAPTMNGYAPVLIALLLFGVGIWRIVEGVKDVHAISGLSIGLGAAAILIAGIIASTLMIITPGSAKVVQFFGRYLGTERRQGLIWAPPLCTHRRISVRVGNFETHTLKVNDADGNPVEIGAIVVWQVADTAKARFAVEDYTNFIQVQSEAALRHVATTHPYDNPGGDGTSLRGSTDQVSSELAREVAARVAVAGLEVVEVRISHLAYAPEIAQAMLQRQQAGAIIAARSRIVEGAVGMVEMALGRLEAQDIVTLDDERKAAMVSNLLVVLCGEARATPVVNTGSLYV